MAASGENLGVGAADQLRKASSLAGIGRFAEAVAISEEVARRSTRNVDAWTLLARLHLHCRNLDQAFAAATLAVAIDPGQADALYVLGRVHKSRGNLMAAGDFYRRAVVARPDDPDLLSSLGILQRECGQLEEAIATYRRALRIRPDHPEANHNLGNALAARGSSDEALDTRERARGLLTLQLEQLRTAAIRAFRENRNADALATLESIFNLSPSIAVDMLSGGEFAAEMTNRHLGSIRLRYAEEAARRDERLYGAVELARRLSVAGGLYERALRHSGRAYELVPSDVTLIEQKLALPAIQSSAESILETRTSYERNLDEILASDLHVEGPDGMFGVSAFFLAYHGENDRDLQMKAAKAMLKAIPSLAMTAPHCAAGERAAGRIRIGFISRFFAAHSIAKTTRGLIDRLSRERFEVFALRITPSVEDDTTRMIRSSADHMIALDPGFFAAREQIAALELDILFYQDIGMEPMSFFLAFARLARVQCVSFGHPNTTGIPNMDYFVSNDLFETGDAPAHYSEKLALLHDLPTLAYYYRPSVPDAVPDRSQFGLPPASRVYLCPQTLFKIHPDFDALMEGILRRDPLGIIVLISGDYEEWTEQLRRRFSVTMPGLADRVIFLPRMGQMRFLELAAAADVVLDTIHFNGMNSSLETFAVGTPVVTLPTGLQRGRHTQAMYRKMGIDDCIARDAADYVDIAVRLGTDRRFARGIRERILASNHVLYEQDAVVVEFERFFVGALRDQQGPDADPRC
jgi:protein O-GlcNAc transferase